MLFLVYIGGLLVLLIYIIMVSRNFSLAKVTIWPILVVVIPFSIILIINIPLLGRLSTKLIAGRGSLVFWPRRLSLLGALLLYVFLRVCNTIIIGGRSLDFGV